MVCDVVFVSIAVKLLMQWAVKLILYNPAHTQIMPCYIASNPGLPRSFFFAAVEKGLGLRLAMLCIRLITVWVAVKFSHS